MQFQPGIDIVDIKRIEEAVNHQGSFAQKVLSPEEYAIYQTYHFKRQISFLAGRFAAKEAYVKALGSGFGRIWFQDITILNDDAGKPTVTQGPVTEGVSLSISHSDELAIAMVVMAFRPTEMDAKVDTYLEDRQQRKHDQEMSE